MTPESYAVKWFIVYYAVFGAVLLGSGGCLVFRPSPVRLYLLEQARDSNPPGLFRKVLKYFFLFTLPCLLFSFIPFSLPELIFSFWSLFMVYLAGSQLLRWPELRKVIRDRSDSLNTVIRWTGVMLLSVSLVIFLLEYLVIKRALMI